jgi:hypothetical protein
VTDLHLVFLSPSICFRAMSWNGNIYTKARNSDICVFSHSCLVLPHKLGLYVVAAGRTLHFPDPRTGTRKTNNSKALSSMLTSLKLHGRHRTLSAPEIIILMSKLGAYLCPILNDSLAHTTIVQCGPANPCGSTKNTFPR